jgi:hypothetical protein
VPSMKIGISAIPLQPLHLQEMQWDEQWVARHDLIFISLPAQVYAKPNEDSQQCRKPPNANAASTVSRWRVTSRNSQCCDHAKHWVAPRVEGVRNRGFFVISSSEFSGEGESRQPEPHPLSMHSLLNFLRFPCIAPPVLAPCSGMFASSPAHSPALLPPEMLKSRHTLCP